MSVGKRLSLGVRARMPGIWAICKDERAVGDISGSHDSVLSVSDCVYVTVLRQRHSARFRLALLSGLFSLQLLVVE